MKVESSLPSSVQPTAENDDDILCAHVQCNIHELLKSFGKYIVTAFQNGKELMAVVYAAKILFLRIVPFNSKHFLSPIQTKAF